MTGHASFVTEPAQHSFCASAATALPVDYSANVSTMQIVLNWDNIPHTPFKIRDTFADIKKYINIAPF
jgi:hypothetical protein